MKKLAGHQRQNRNCKSNFVPLHAQLHHCNINNCPDLDIIFPQTKEELDKTALDFKAVSSQQLIAGCVGSLDGVLVKVRTPAFSEVGTTQDACFSGHHKCHGVNIQAVCDALCTFNFLPLLLLEEHLTQLPSRRQTFHLSWKVSH